MAKLLIEDRRIFRHTEDDLEGKLVREPVPGEPCECCDDERPCWRIASQCCPGVFTPVYVPCECPIFEDPEFDECIFRVNPAFEDDCWRITPGSPITYDEELVALGRLYCPSYPCEFDSCLECCPDTTEPCTCCSIQVCPQLPEEITLTITVTYDPVCAAGLSDPECVNIGPITVDAIARYSLQVPGLGGCFQPECTNPLCKHPICDPDACSGVCCCCYMVGAEQCPPEPMPCWTPAGVQILHGFDCGQCEINCCRCHVSGDFRFIPGDPGDTAYWRADINVSPIAELDTPSDPSQGCATGNCWSANTIIMHKIGCGPPIGDYVWQEPQPGGIACVSGVSMSVS